MCDYICECTWNRHLSSYLKHHLSLSCSFSHGTDDILVWSVDHRVAIDVCNLVSNLEPAVHVCCPAWNYGSNCGLERERVSGGEI